MDNHQRYTIILDYLGGTYVSQVFAASPMDAFNQWLVEKKYAEVDQLAVFEYSQLSDDTEEEDFVPLRGLVNVWCNSFIVGDDNLALFNFVLTSDNEPTV